MSPQALPAKGRRLVPAVVDRRCAAGGANVVLLGRILTDAGLAAGPAAATTVSLRGQGQALQVGQVHAGQSDGGFQVLAVLLRGWFIASFLGLFRQQLVRLPG